MRLDPSLRFPQGFEDGAGYRSALEKRVLGGAGISWSVMAEGGGFGSGRNPLLHVNAEETLNLYQAASCV